MALGPEIRVSTLHSASVFQPQVPSTRSLHQRYAFGAAFSSARLLQQWRKNAVETPSVSDSGKLQQKQNRRKENATEKQSSDPFSEEDEEDFSDGSDEESSSGEVDAGFRDFEFDSQGKCEDQSADAEDLIAERARKIDELCANVRERKDFKVFVGELVALHPFRLDKFQRLAIQAFLKGSSVVVSAPTSSGKTVIAEAAATATLARGKRLYYTTPLKALSNQKFREFRSIFGEASVGLITGDVSFNRDAPIVIMTAEILRNKFYLSAGNEDSLGDVEVVVLDEIHYIGDLTRGTVWEETVIYCPKNIQLICLSATIANPEELAGWIAKVHGPTELINSSKRPVPLTWHISRRSEMLPLLNERGTGMNRKLLISKRQLEEIHSRKSRGRTTSLERKMPEDQLQVLLRFQVPRIKDTLSQMVERNMLPAIWFILSRKRCDEAVQYLQDASLLSTEELQQVESALAAFREQHPDAIRESAVQPLYQGVAAHHAGCLPLWKSFIEELFQKGLVKVVFATETLAAGINMPARSTVLSSFVSKGHRKISANSVLQMAGRAGRRGIDVEGHVVVAQTPFRGPEECYKMMKASSDPVVSQFTATYGMVLNLLEDAYVTPDQNDQGQSLGEARSLIEQSFGNYIGSEILVGAKSKLVDLKTEIETLENGQSTDSLSILYGDKIKEFHSMREKLEMKERKERSLRFKVERLRLSIVQSQLKEFTVQEQLPYVCVTYVNAKTGREHSISGVVVEMRNQNPFSLEKKSLDKESVEASYIALGCDGFWYRFPAKLVRRVYKSEVNLEKQTTLKSYLPEVKWELVGDENVSKSTTACGSFDLPALNKLDAESEVPEELHVAEKLLAEQQRSLGKLSKKIAEIDEREINNLEEKLSRMRAEKIVRLKAKSERIRNRIKQMQPSGWKEFLQVVKILKASGAMHPDTHELLPLGKIARAIRGSNELWMAIALQDPTLASLRSSELAGVAATLVSESMKSRLQVSSGIYEPSSVVMEWVDKMEKSRLSLLKLQEDHGLEFPCELDPQLAGFVEAWASGVNWKELEIAEIMDEGDFARLLRRTIDLLSQIPHLPHLDQALSLTGKEAARNMDRPPISEPVGG